MALTKIDDRGLKTPIDLLDSEKIRFGTGNDLEIYHNGTDSEIKGNTGSLTIKNANNLNLYTATNEEAIVAVANGSVSLYHNAVKKLETTSGGVTVTGTLIATANVEASNNIQLLDDKKLLLGSANDLQIYHSTSLGNVIGATGGHTTKFYGPQVEMYSLDGTKKSFVSDSDGAVELYHNNVKRFETTNYGASMDGLLNFNIAGDKILLPDSGKILLGASSDLQFYHDGTHSYIYSDNGELKNRAAIWKVVNEANSEIQIKATENAGVELYYNNAKHFETTTTGVSWGTTRLRCDDNGMIELGTGQDLKIYHDGSNAYIKSEITGHLNINAQYDVYINKQDGTEPRAKFHNDGSVELYYDGTKRFETNSGGAKVTGTFRVDDGSTTDNRLAIGTGGDLLIYHDGSNSWMRSYTGQFKLETNDSLQIFGGNGETLADFHQNGACNFYHNNNKKINTQQYGVDVDSNLYIKGSEGTSASLYLMADESDDNGDAWRINSNQDDNDLTISNNTSGSYVDKLTILKTGELGIGCIPTQPFYILKSHNGRTKSVVQNNWGSNATAELNLISPTDELAIVKYASGDAHVDLSNTANIKFTIGGNEKLRLQSGGGISFNGDSSADNALNDYEEGTWTPNPLFGSTDAGETADANGGLFGRYTKVGNLVYCHFSVNFSSRSGSASGNFKLDGLPFAISANNWNEDGGTVHWYSGLTSPNSQPTLICENTNKVTFIQSSGALENSNPGSWNDNVDQNEIGTGLIRIRGSFTYHTAA